MRSQYTAKLSRLASAITRSFHKHSLRAMLHVKRKPANSFSSSYAEVYRPLKEVRTGLIMDPMSAACWGPEVDGVELTPTNWTKEIDSLALLLVESCWSGIRGEWRHHMTAKTAPSPELRALVNSCKDRGIPTVFWNKEDPVHYSEFISTAALFDYIFTTDEATIEKYQRDLQHTRIGALPFAAQPAIHNPDRSLVEYAKYDVLFAGTFFRDRFPDRRGQMEALLGGAHDGDRRKYFKFDILSRHFRGDAKYQFPAVLKRHVVGKAPYERLLSLGKEYKVHLNVNSVPDSETMCSRRIFETFALGSCVVSTPSPALNHFFGENVIPVANTRTEATAMLRSLVNSPILREKVVHRAQRRIWAQHTYRERSLRIQQTIAPQKAVPTEPLVSIICSTERPESLEHLFQQIEQQVYPRLELSLCTHGFELDEGMKSRLESLSLENTMTITMPPTEPLGTCLNLLVRGSSGSIIAKFDDDDFYLPNYLVDQVHTLVNMEADLVGKASIFFYLSHCDLLVRRWPALEHKWAERVAGSTFVGWKNVFLKFPFQRLRRGEDSAFLKELNQAGCKIYSADRFNYLAVRGQKAHTWKIADLDILAYSVVESFGLNLEHVGA